MGIGEWNYVHFNHKVYQLIIELMSARDPNIYCDGSCFVHIQFLIFEKNFSYIERIHTLLMGQFRRESGTERQIMGNRKEGCNRSRSNNRQLPGSPVTWFPEVSLIFPLVWCLEFGVGVLSMVPL
ncbi:uncharacterized protein LOC112904831 isoform X2 [Agrilus planipennis]|uniref:Uncharacterized protein LOC112904831 isoform X2 n=1 Tax=Agrilus planipennis TaxID=224129 RepID=A0A7F5R6S3_AGRPL|nr:uncharacterized protein LOC112904831 isoform X2 [Agrilus planipennis]